jgi:hypothetical protein
MKLIVLVPSDEYLASAGARIRYGGLAPGLVAAGFTLCMESIASFDPSTTDCDALLISKCHDARAIIAAAILSERGKLVGVDLFDDYFSQHSNSGLVRYRQWLRELLQDCNFSLCSTETMAQVVRGYAPDLPIHVVNDPARDHDAEEACQLADAKGAEARQEQVIRATWFGVGDNPHFKVGLTDLSAHGSVLSELMRGGMAVDLTVLTNRRALQADGLELISRLPVPCTVIEWSEDVERQVLEKSLLAFLPVGAQAFSAAKSLNRAWTALTYGCQVLSSGLPLYAALEPIIYRNPVELISDLADGKLRLSTSNLESYKERLNAAGSAEKETLRLGEFLRRLTPQKATGGRLLCAVHGLSTRAEVHHLIQSVGGLSVASPHCSAKLDFDVFFRGPPGRMKMAVSRRGSESLLNPSSRVQSHSQHPTQRRAEPVAYQQATYAPSMREIRCRLEKAFGPVRVIVSETSRLPLSPSADT